eukprot:6868518-Prymnesium_polylepis.1
MPALTRDILQEFFCGECFGLRRRAARLNVSNEAQLCVHPTCSVQSSDAVFFSIFHRIVWRSKYAFVVLWLAVEAKVADALGAVLDAGVRNDHGFGTLSARD